MPASPSLLIVPARFKTGKLYTQIATTSAGLVLGASGDFTVTRATTATRFNSAGLIESVASGVPRLDYYTSGGTAGCPALLVEPSGSNLFQRSEEFDDGYWTKTNLNTTGTPPWVNVATAPNGTMTAEKLIANTANSTHLITRTGLTSGSYTFSVFAKAGEETIMSLWIAGNSIRGQFDLSNGTIQFSSAEVSSKIEPYGNGWYRCSIYSSVATTTAAIYMRTGGAFEGNNTNGFFIWGAQLETGSIATSYIPTTTGTVTRNADVINLSGAVSGCIGQTEGTLYAEVDVRNFTNGNRIVCLSDGTSDNRIILQKGANSTLQAIVTNATSGVVDISTASGRTAGIYKIAIGYKQDDFAVYVNGSQTGTDDTGGVPACNQIFIGKIETTATTNQFNDRIRAAALYTTRLTNSELAALTT
jgi:hypothetical protein